MTKLVLAAVVAVLATLGCRPPSLGSRAQVLRARMSALATRTVAVVGPVAPPVAAVQVDLGGFVQPAAQREPQREPAPEPHPQRTPAVEPTITRATAPAATYVLRGETRGGARICTKFASMDACNAECTKQIRTAAQLALGVCSA